MKKYFLLGALSASLLLAACSDKEGSSSSEAGDATVVATTGQIADAAKVIVGDKIKVETLMGPGVDPHLYKATQSDVTMLDDADMIIYNGLHLEGQLDEIFEKMRKDKAVVAAAEILDSNKLLADEENSSLYDPHVWFDISLWSEVVDGIGDALVEEFPEHKETFEKNEKQYLKELDELKKYVNERVNELKPAQRHLVTAHDAFNYFGESLDFTVSGLQGLSTEAEYGVKDVENMVDYLVENQIKAIFVESSVSDKAMKAVIEGAKDKNHTVTIGGELFSDAMGAEGTEEGTYIGMYKYNVNTIVDALK